MKRQPLTMLTALLLLSFLVLSRESGAYESYHSAAGQASGYCFPCHPEFLNGPGSALHDLHELFFPLNRCCSLCHIAQAGHDNPFTLWSTIGKDGGDLYGCAGCHGRDYGETVSSDYRGFEIAGLPKMSGYGLRRHHLLEGVTACGNCHGEAPPDGRIAPESQAPPYYGDGEVKLNDPCADGLDNDGDGLEDAGDPDCQAALTPDISLMPMLCSFPDTIMDNISEPMVLTISNDGTADLTVFSIICSSGTDFAVDSNEGPDSCGSDTFTLIPGDSCTVAVSFCPCVPGDLNDTLTVASNDPDEPEVNVALSGTSLEASGDTPPTGGSSGCAVSSSSEPFSTAAGTCALILLGLGWLGLRRMKGCVYPARSSQRGREEKRNKR